MHICMYLYLYPPPCPLRHEGSDIMPMPVGWKAGRSFYSDPPLRCRATLRNFAQLPVTFFLWFFGSFFDTVSKPLLDRFWCQLAPNLASKIDPKSIQDPPKIDSKFYLVLSTFLNRFLIDFGSNLGPTNPPVTRKKQWFEDFYDFACLPFGWLLKPTWLHFGRVLGAKLAPSWHQIAPKIDLRKHQKNDHLLHRF